MELILLILGAGFALALSGLGGGDGGSSDPAGEDPVSPSGGTSGPDLLLGTDFDDTLEGLGGNDSLFGAIGNDLLEGNGGDDEVYGEIGNDTLFGGFGNDTLGGGTGSDSLLGSDGDDELRGGADNDTLEGGANADFLEGDGGDDFLRGGPGKDFLTGNEGQDSMEGGPGDDTLIGIVGNFADVPDSSDDGADTLEGWAGADRIVLGTGDQAYGEFATATADGAGDTFIIGTWIGDPPATVHDFDPAVDQIHIYYDSGDTGVHEPEITSTEIGGETTYEITFADASRLLVQLGVLDGEVTADNITVFDIAPAV